ncbi:MAG: hypothetical protein IAF38_14305 [Bacteroidia bacterium]|nr:hypothetical protein [Bacteroidia bacterium]
MSISNKSYDVAYIGASDVNRDIDINTIKQKTGLNGINLGQDGSCVEENFTLFKKFIYNGNHVKHLFIQLYVTDLDSSMRFDINTEKFIPFVKDSVVGSMLQRNVSPFRFFLWKYVPFAAYAEYNSKYPLEDFFYPADRKKLFDSLNKNSGTELLQESGHKFTNGPAYSSALVIDENITKFISFAKSRGIKITVITLPRWISWVKRHSNRRAFTEKIDSLCKKNSISYFNFASDKQQWFNNDSLFYDNNHFNRNGAIYFSSVFADSVLLKEIERK